MMARIMPLANQKRMLIERFVKLNPNIDVQLVDWGSLDKKLSFNENLEDIENEYPQFRWRGPAMMRTEMITCPPGFKSIPSKRSYCRKITAKKVFTEADRVKQICSTALKIKKPRSTLLNKIQVICERR